MSLLKLAFAFSLASAAEIISSFSVMHLDICCIKYISIQVFNGWNDVHLGIVDVFKVACCCEVVDQKWTRLFHSGAMRVALIHGPCLETPKILTYVSSGQRIWHRASVGWQFKRRVCVYSSLTQPHVRETSPKHWTEHLQNVVNIGERKAIEEYMGVLDRVNSLEGQIQGLTDEGLQAMTRVLKEEIKALGGGREVLLRDDILSKAFAVVREASRRILGMRHYDVQILGGIALSRGTVAEMRTGEGKTLVAILPAYLYGLEGNGAHIVTVNDYLAQRDAEWVGKVLSFLGCSVGVVTSKTPQHMRAAEMAADVTYLTAYELSFMYLQDNSAPPSFPVALNRPLHFAVVDEVDSILIDEARNPFIVNMPGTDNGLESYWTIAAQIAMELQGPPVPENMGPEDLMNYFDGIPIEDFMSVDFIPDLRIKGTTITRKGMARAVKLLAHPRIGRVFIATDINSPELLYSVILEVDSSSGNDDRSRGGRLIVRDISSGGDNKAWLRNSSSDQVIEISDCSDDSIRSALQKHGFAIMPSDNVPDNVWYLAVPSVLWNGGAKAWGRFLNQATRAVHAFHKDVDYIVRGGEIVVIDTATGRERERSRWQAGLHQALEAKEMILQADDKLKIKPEDFDQGKITYQVLFSEYNTLSGMTGTAATEAEEFEEAYGLSVVRIPPHRPSLRVDNPTEVYGGKQAWSERILRTVNEAVRAGRPVLIGTMSVEASEEVYRIISSAPIDPKMTDLNTLTLRSNLSRVPQTLPSPPVTLDGLQPEDNPQLQAAYEFYEALMVDYDVVLKYLKKLANKSSPKRLDLEDLRYSMTVLRSVVSSKAWSLKNPTELDAIQECYDVLVETLKKSTLSESYVINLLNARPERSRMEAEIVAQAGVPGTITVATSMAGRGTDILLGGNPKGLLLGALKFLLFPYMNVRSQTMDIPLAKVHPAFVGGEESMEKHLPRIIYLSYRQCTDEMKKNRYSISLEPLEFFEKVVEKTEMIRSHLKLSLPAQQGLDYDLSSMLLTYANAFEQEDWSSEIFLTGILSELECEVPHEEFKDLLRYSLLQWLWFDDQCSRMAEEVRSSGGLCVVIASVPESRRSELQLRGRAGRQGDPGTTSIIASLDDPILSSALLPNQQRDIWNYIEESGSSNEALPSLVIDPIIRTIIRNQEQLQQGGRDVARKYDAVIDSYRRHVYRLRRILTRGGELSRASLFHNDLRNTAEDIVQMHCNESSGVDTWNIEAVIDDMMALLQQPRLSLVYTESQGKDLLSVSHVCNPENVILSMHVIEDYIMAIAEELEETSQQDATVLHAQICTLLQKRKPIPNLDFRKTSVSLPSMRRRSMVTSRQCRNITKSGAYNELVLWAGDVLCSMYETKRHLAHESLICSRLTEEPLNTFQAGAILRVWERDIALETIDALWSDFLQDATVLQAASQSRAFSMFDPVDEFRLEAANTFTNLLRQYSHIISSKILGPVDLMHLRYLLDSSKAPSSIDSLDKASLDYILKNIRS